MKCRKGNTVIVILLMLILPSKLLLSKWYFSTIDTIQNTTVYYSNLVTGPRGYLHLILTQGDTTFHLYKDSLRWHKIKFHSNFKVSKILFGNDSTLYGIYKNKYVVINWEDLSNGIVTNQETLPLSESIIKSAHIIVVDSIPFILISKQRDMYHTDEIVYTKDSTKSNWIECILDTSVYQGNLHNLIFYRNDTIYVSYNKPKENPPHYQAPVIAFKYIHDTTWTKIHDSPVLYHFNLLKPFSLQTYLYFITWYDWSEIAIWKRDSIWRKINVIDRSAYYQDSHQKRDSIYILVYERTTTRQYWLAKNSFLTLSDSFNYILFNDTLTNVISSPRLGIDPMGNTIVVYKGDNFLKSARYVYYPYPELNIQNDSLFSYGQVGDTLIVGFKISNSGDVNLNWYITSPYSWIIPVEQLGVLPPYKDTTLYIIMVTSNMTNFNQGYVYLHTNDPNDSLFTIKVGCYVFEDSMITILGKDDHVQERELSLSNGSHQIIMRKFIVPHTSNYFVLHSVIARLGIIQSSGTTLPVKFYILPDSNGYPNFNNIIFTGTASVYTEFITPPLRLYYRLKGPILMSSDTFWVGISPAHPNIISLKIMIDTTSKNEENTFIFDSLSNTLESINGNALINAFCVIETYNNNISLKSLDNDQTFEIPDRYIVPSFNVIEPTIHVVNDGKNNADNIPIYLRIFNSLGNEIYNSQIIINHLNSQSDTVISFSPFTILDSGLTYIFKAYTQYPDDFGGDDTLEVKVISSPTEWLKYDLGLYNIMSVVAGIGGGPETGRWKRLSFSSTPVQILNIGLYGSADSIKFYFFEDSDLNNIHDFEPLDTFFLQSMSYSFGGGSSGDQRFRTVNLENDSIIINSPEVYISAVLWGGHVGYTGDLASGINDNYFRAPVIFCYLNRDTQYTGNIYHGNYQSTILRVQVRYPSNPATLVHETKLKSIPLIKIKYENLTPYLIIYNVERGNNPLSISIYDVSGRRIKLIRRIMRKGVITKINLSQGLHSGVYFLIFQYNHAKPKKYKFIVF